MFAIPIIALLLFGLLLLWWRYSDHVSKQAEQQLTLVPAEPTGWRRLMPRRIQASQQLRAWVVAHAPERVEALPPAAASELVGWVRGLSLGELRAWEQATRSFCAEAGMHLAWLWGRELQDDPDLHAEMSTMVLLYSLSYSRARRAVSTVAAVKELQAWRANPKRKHQRRFGDRLHAALVRRGLITIAPELYLAPEKRRRSEAIAAIKQLDAEQHMALRATVVLLLEGAELTALASAQPERAAEAPNQQNEVAHGDQLPPLDSRPA